jgi:hypothetical protein
LMASGGVRRCARGPGVVELLRSPKLHRWMSDNAVKVVQGSGGAQGSPVARNREAGQIPAVALRGKSRPLKRSEQRAAGSGKCLGTGRGCCALLGGLRRGGAARPRRRGALLRRGGRGGVEPGLGAALAGRVRAQGSRGGLKGLAADLGERAQGRVPRGSRPAISAVTGAGASGEKGLTWGAGLSAALGQWALAWAGLGKEKERPAGKEGWVGFSHGLGCFGFGLALGFGLLFYFPFSFLFLLQTKFEFKSKFEFKPHSI